jgi:hypothetical protein
MHLRQIFLEPNQWITTFFIADSLFEESSDLPSVGSARAQTGIEKSNFDSLTPFYQRV